jgi:hypothetical protein
MIYLRILKVLSLVVAGISANAASAETQLVMAEEMGCVWCETWNEVIAPIYPKTAEGKAAPLRRIDIHDPLPEDMSIVRPLNFTPTFLLMIDGQEMGRIEGYPGEDFFWALLAQLMKDADVDFEVSG